MSYTSRYAESPGFRFTEVFADGSFVEEKDHPNDIDGYFVCSLTDLSSGIRDRQGHELEFPSAFRQSRRNGRPRDIIKLKFGGLP